MRIATRPEADFVRRSTERALTILSSDPAYIASLEKWWRRLHPTVSPAEALDCSEAKWRWIALCRRPRVDLFEHDLAEIAAKADVRRSHLLRFLVGASAAEQLARAPSESDLNAIELLAARAKTIDDA